MRDTMPRVALHAPAVGPFQTIDLAKCFASSLLLPLLGHSVGTPCELFFINFAVAVDVGFEQKSFQLGLVNVSESTRSAQLRRQDREWL